MQFYDYQDCDERIKTDGFPIEFGFLTNNSLDETLSEELIPVGTDECECNYPEKRTLLPTLWNPRTIKTLLQGRKMAVF